MPAKLPFLFRERLAARLQVLPPELPAGHPVGEEESAAERRGAAPGLQDEHIRVRHQECLGLCQGPPEAVLVPAHRRDRVRAISRQKILLGRSIHRYPAVEHGVPQAGRAREEYGEEQNSCCQNY